MVKWETKWHMEEGWDEIPKTKSMRTPLGAIFYLSAISESTIASGLLLTPGESACGSLPGETITDY